MFLRSLFRFAAAGLCLAAFAAPAVEPEEDGEPVAVMDEKPIYDFFQKIDELFSAGDTNAATKAFFEADDDPALKPFEELVRGVEYRLRLQNLGEIVYRLLVLLQVDARDSVDAHGVDSL